MTKKTDLSWAQLKAIWGDQFGITPTEVHQLLERHWLKENWTTYKGNMWKDPQNIELFKKYVQHVYDYMSLMEIHWRAALIELFNDNDSKTAAWRNDFMMEGWLSKDDVKPMIKKVKSLTRSLKSKGLLVKKKKK